LLYKLDSSGHKTVLHYFTGGADGGSSESGVTLDGAGNLYGTTAYGGANGCGVVYKLDSAGTLTVLYTFTCQDDGEDPFAGVVRDSAGNLYGTAGWGGANGYGDIYKLDPAGEFTVLYSFPAPPVGIGGCNPFRGVVMDAAGNLYGTSSPFTTGCQGVVYKFDTTGNYQVLYTFSGAADGRDPGSVVLDPAGNVYGATYDGGLLTCGYENVGCGVVFKVDPSGNETVLFTFTGGVGGQSPVGPIVRDTAGNLYGTAGGGGADGGVVFRVTPP
jgi:uncharacterized repeat protein (TIGR03803 family)